MNLLDNVEQNWHTREDVFEILHFLVQFKNPGISAEEVTELQGEDKAGKITDILTSLEEINVVESKEVDGENEYWMNPEIFTRLASEKWAEDLSERQKKFIKSFSMKYLDDRRKGTLRRMLTENIVQGIYEKRNDLDNEILELAGKLSLENEAYSSPGIYIELAISDME